MSDAWEDRKKAAEESFFQKKEQEALERLRSRGTSDVRKSPITGDPMEQVTIHGVVVDRCKTSGGLWLDKGELDQIVKAIKEASSDSNSAGWLSSFFSEITGKK